MGLIDLCNAIVREGAEERVVRNALDVAVVRERDIGIHDTRHPESERTYPYS